MPRRRVAPATPAAQVLHVDETSLLDVVDNLLNKGVVLTGEITLGLAQIDLVYARVSLLLCAADRLLPDGSADVVGRPARRPAARR
jgi:hypothetical protein